MLDRENNRRINENGSSSEYNRSAKEFKTVNEFKNSKEMGGLRISEDNVNEGTVKTVKKVDTQKASQTIAGTAVVATASLVVIASSGLINLQMDGSINEIQFLDNGIKYSIQVTDVAPDNPLWFDVFDGSRAVARYEIINENTETYTGELSGFISIEDLNVQTNLTDAGLSYDFHLCGDTGLVDRTYDSWTLEIKQLSSLFNGIDSYCDCSNSGCFLFTMDFVDDYGIFTDFTATITDADGKTSSCIFTENLHEQQKIFVLDLAGEDVDFVLSYKADGTLVEHSFKVKI